MTYVQHTFMLGERVLDRYHTLAKDDVRLDDILWSQGNACVVVSDYPLLRLSEKQFDRITGFTLHVFPAYHHQREFQHAVARLLDYVNRNLKCPGEVCVQWDQVLEPKQPHVVTLKKPPWYSGWCLAEVSRAFQNE